ncbi:hypothetical protein PVK06_030686 [Gossypium arboreum]|uniref:Uncharacterized protein n=1 Tax=Gossypium arboreum TaxID=29729 RepID=A0ABR0NRH8_GOSAR|nr:hypothetical protein PVK06_030686 [Gossypium arboreum]
MLENVTGESTGSQLVGINLSKEAPKGQNSKGDGSKRGWELNKTLKGPGSHFKNFENIRASFADSMKRAAKLIASKFDGKSAKDL